MGHGRFSSFEARKGAHLRMTPWGTHHRISSRDKGGAVRRDKTLTAPCRCFEILAGKCGFTGQRSDDLTVAARAERATRSRS